MAEPAARPSARHAAERMLEQLLADAHHAYGDDREAHATAIIRAFPRVWWENHGYNRRLMFAASWEPDPRAAAEIVAVARAKDDGAPTAADEQRDLAACVEEVLGVMLTPWQRTLLERLEHSVESRRGRPTVNAHNNAEVDGG